MKGKFNIIAAILKSSRGIGSKNMLPWNYINEDMSRFMNVTKSLSNNKKNCVIMGRNTWESIDMKPLPDRLNVVIGNKFNYDMSYKNLLTFKNFRAAMFYIDTLDHIDERYVIGGEELYQSTINDLKCDKVYLTEIPDKLKISEPDTFFPELPQWFKKIDITYGKDVTFKTYQNKANRNWYSNENKYLQCLDSVVYLGENIMDRTGTGTKQLFDQNLRLRIDVVNPEVEKHEDLIYTIPMLTTKKIYIKAVIEELLWFIRGETNANLLKEKKVHIWDGHTSIDFLEKRGLDYIEGELGPGYGHQWIYWGKEWETSKYKSKYKKNDNEGINQIKRILDELSTNPKSRRAILSAWNVNDLDKMALVPCHILYNWLLTDFSKGPKLNCKMTMRSSDLFLGLPFNILSTSIFNILMSRSLNILPGDISLSLCSVHVYNNHIEQVKKQVKRTPLEQPKLRIKKQIRSWEDMCMLEYDDFEIIDYYSWPRLKGKMAI